MKIFKEFVELKDDSLNGGKYRYIIRTLSYNKTFSYLQRLLRAAKQDFPDLDFDTTIDVEVIVYGGNCYKRTRGIEFNTNEMPPSDYKQVNQVELTL